MPTLNMFPRFARGSLSMGPSSKKQMHILEGSSRCPAGSRRRSEFVSARRDARRNGPEADLVSAWGRGARRIVSTIYASKDAAQKLSPTRTAFFAFQQTQTDRQAPDTLARRWRRLLASWAAATCCYTRTAVRDKQTFIQLLIERIRASVLDL